MTRSLTIALLLFGFLNYLSTGVPATALSEDVKWERVNIPAQGDAGGWTLAPGSDVKYPTMAKDGAIYVYANPTGTPFTLYKSRDGGHSWTAIGDVRDTITAIAAAPDDAAILYYATASIIYKSADSGKTFSPLPPNPGGAGSDNISITSLDVGRVNSRSTVAVGTADSDAGQFGGVYTLDESKPITAWENTGLGNYDAATVRFSPNYASDRQLLAVVTDETDTLVSARINNSAWNQIFSRVIIPGRAARGAVAAFPADYDTSRGEYALFIGIDTGANAGDVFKITGRMAGENSTGTDLNAGAVNTLTNIDITGLTASGNASAARLTAGAAGSTRIYYSSDGGTTWTRSAKEPTGQTRTYLLNAPDGQTVYAATTGAESAFSYTQDGGASWNQIGMIDGRISSNGIIDMAASPNYTNDESLFLLTFDSVALKHSLWRSRNGGVSWERVFTSSLPNVGTLSKVTLSPGYGKAGSAVFLAGTAYGNPAMWKSADGGQTFVYRSAPLAIDIWRAIDDNTLLLGSYNGSSGLVYSTENSGFSFSTGTAASSLPLKSIATSPDYARDQTILAGNSGGWIYYSTDNGSSFKPLPRDAITAPLTGSVYVAFDPDFPRNKIVYAASNTASKGIYRFVLDKSTKWERIDSTLPTGGTLNQISVSSEGALYAANSQSANSTASKGGIERALDPSNTETTTFETVTNGIEDGASLSGIWLAGNRLWAIDTQNTRVLTFSDTLARPVLTSSPAHKAGNTGKSVTLAWEILNGATEYEWQIDTDTDFSNLPAGFSGVTKAGSVRLPSLDSDTTYHWRVRASKPVLSRWSAVSTFSTGLGTAVTAPELYSPKPGAEGTSLKPLFQWSAITGASHYELVLADDISFTNPVIARTGDNALPATAWQSTMILAHDTAYYWKVRASGQGSFSAWSAVGAFITAAAPAAAPAVNEPVAPQPSPTPVPPPPSLPPASPPPAAQTELPDWFPYVIGGALTAIVILLITVLALVINMRRG